LVIKITGRIKKRKFTKAITIKKSHVSKVPYEKK